MTQTEALRLALEALEPIPYKDDWTVAKETNKAITAIKEALAQPEQEPMTKAGELRAMKTELWKQPKQDGKCKHCTDGCPACDARKLPEQEPVAFINVEQRKLEWAKYMSWDTPTVVNLPKIPLYTISSQRNYILEEVAREIDKMKVFEADTMASIAAFIRDMKK